MHFIMGNATLLLSVRVHLATGVCGIPGHIRFRAGVSSGEALVYCPAAASRLLPHIGQLSLQCKSHSPHLTSTEVSCSGCELQPEYCEDLPI